MQTVEQLDPSHRLAIEYAVALPADFITEKWLRPLVSSRFPEVGREPQPGYPDTWQALVQHLLSLRLVRSRTRDSLQLHQAVRAALRLGLGSTELEARRSEISKYRYNLESLALATRPDAERWGQLKMFDELENASLEKPWWHPSPAQFVRHISIDVDEYLFECCGRRVAVPDDGVPSQFRLDGCASVDDSVPLPERRDPRAILMELMDLVRSQEATRTEPQTPVDGQASASQEPEVRLPSQPVGTLLAVIAIGAVIAVAAALIFPEVRYLLLHR
jgi:hypothetical protein